MLGEVAEVKELEGSVWLLPVDPMRSLDLFVAFRGARPDASALDPDLLARRIEREVNFLDQTILYGYDAMGNVTSVSYSGGTNAAALPKSKAYTYDGFGRLASLLMAR